jgi:hypothetical protein
MIREYFPGDTKKSDMAVVDFLTSLDLPSIAKECPTLESLYSKLDKTMKILTWFWTYIQCLSSNVAETQKELFIPKFLRRFYIGCSPMHASVLKLKAEPSDGGYQTHWSQLEHAISEFELGSQPTSHLPATATPSLFAAGGNDTLESSSGIPPPPATPPPFSDPALVERLFKLEAAQQEQERLLTLYSSNGYDSARTHDRAGDNNKSKEEHRHRDRKRYRSPSPPPRRPSTSYSKPRTSPPRDVCRDWKRGRCSRGTNCLFMHSKHPNPCRQFAAKGSCSYGDRCKFTHSTSNSGGFASPRTDKLSKQMEKLQSHLANLAKSAAEQQKTVSSLVAYSDSQKEAKAREALIEQGKQQAADFYKQSLQQMLFQHLNAPGSNPDATQQQAVPTFPALPAPSQLQPQQAPLMLGWNGYPFSAAMQKK